MTDFLVIAGLSGAGRSSAADDLEDLGWFVVDNLPVALFSKIIELSNSSSSLEKVALVIGTGPYQGDVVAAIRELRATGSAVRVLFLDASTEALVRRYESTRRRHPHDAGSLVETIDGERGLLEPVLAEADVVIDTTSLNIHELRDRMVELFGSESPGPAMQLRIQSFGYKHGLPLDADVVLDCRFLPNPHWHDDLRPLTGRDPAVRDFVLSQDLAEPFLASVEAMLTTLLPAYVNEGKAYLTVAFGCTGGRHRSVAIAEEMARRLRSDGQSPIVTHRDVDK